MASSQNGRCSYSNVRSLFSIWFVVDVRMNFALETRGRQTIVPPPSYRWRHMLFPSFLCTRAEPGVDSPFLADVFVSSPCVLQGCLQARTASNPLSLPHQCSTPMKRTLHISPCAIFPPQSGLSSSSSPFPLRPFSFLAKRSSPFVPRTRLVGIPI